MSAYRNNQRTSLGVLLLMLIMLLLSSCGIIRTTYRLTKGTVVMAYKVTKFAGSTVYTVGGFTFDVVTAPFSWPLTHEDIDTIDGLPPKEAIRQGRVKASPYVVHGRRYVPMTVGQAQTYRETGVASWYGMETYRQKGGHMTANGEAFNPNGLSAAHKHLPLPMFVRVTNLSNRRSIVVRVNDRGPFVGERIIDLSYAAAVRLGMHLDGTALVEIEALRPGGSLAQAPVTAAPEASPDRRFWLQAGAFSDPANAERLRASLRQEGIGNVAVQSEERGSRTLYRVRVGPYRDATGVEEMLGRLRALNIHDAHLADD